MQAGALDPRAVDPGVVDPTGPESDEPILDVERLVAGGAGLAHEGSGRVVLVDGALPGERVLVRVTARRARMVSATTIEVLDPAPSRVAAPCPAVAAGCGGCDLQHADPVVQPELKVGVVVDALRRSDRRQDLGEVPVLAGPALEPWGYRSSVRCGVDNGRLAFHGRRSDGLVAVDGCLVAHDSVQEVIRTGRFPGATEVTVRAGIGTGERLVVVSPTASAEVVVPDGVLVVGADELRRGRRAWLHEVVCGQTFRISALSFFQSGPVGAEALVDAVRRATGPLGPTDRLADLYGGVGLFAATLGAAEPMLVERSASSVADARVNLAGRGARIVRSSVERWNASAADVVIADPARTGLGRDAVRVVAATGARRVVLVACDVASLARDLVLLAASGYRTLGIEVVDLFPNTHHVEAVAVLELR